MCAGHVYLLGGESPLFNPMEVKNKGRCREAGSEGSVNRIREPMYKNRIQGSFCGTSQQCMTKSSIHRKPTL